MLRTTVYLEEEAALALRRLSEAHGRPQAELIREAINTYIADLHAKDVRRLPPGAGGYHSGQTDVSARAEDLLRQRAKNRK
jgi:predicted DNA-binding protein